MPVTLQQIAEAAGVSRGTVDRALKDRGRVRPEVAEEDKEYSKGNGVSASLAGRALVMAKRNLKIGIHHAVSPDPFHGTGAMRDESCQTGGGKSGRYCGDFSCGRRGCRPCHGNHAGNEGAGVFGHCPVSVRRYHAQEDDQSVFRGVWHSHYHL